jgi:hypothetical protein
MTPAQRSALTNLRRQLLQRSERIRKGAALTQFSVVPIGADGFEVIGEWPGGECRRSITFADHFSLRAGKIVENQSTCRFSQNIIRWLLQSRGI